MSEKLATKCEHKERPEKAKGLCSPCYRAYLKASRIEKGDIRLDEETGVDTATGKDVLANDDDKEYAAKLERILWGWINDGEDETEIVDDDGNRDYKTEVRLRDMKDQKAMKAATILGRKYIGEKKVEEKVPEQLPGQAELNNITSGWMRAAQTPTPTKRERLKEIAPSDDGYDA